MKSARIKRIGGAKGHHTAGTVANLIKVNGQSINSRPIGPNFTQILPRKMAELVSQGLFIKDDNIEGGYRITSLGLKKLKELDPDT